MLIQDLANTIEARENCVLSGNDDWFNKHKQSIETMMENAPDGGGFDRGTTLDDKSTYDKVIFNTEYHHMNTDGYYDGWTRHKIVVTPSFNGMNIKVSGRNKNNIKDYIGDVFYDWLSFQECIRDM